MRYTFAFLAWLLVITPWLPAQTTAQYAPTAAENALLWEISGAGLPEPSYLFGTIHLISKADFVLTDRTTQAFAKTNRVAFEINMEEMNDISKLMPMLMKAFMSNGKTLRDLLSKEEYALVKAHFEGIGLPLMLVERIKPMFLSALGSGDMSQMQANGETVSYEIELMKLAQEQQKQVAGLETMAFQMSVFDSIPYEAQARMLVESIQAGKDGNEQFEALVALYKAQDLVGLNAMLETDESIGQYGDILLAKRNRNWVPVMKDMMREKPTFFAVGAGHLAGEQGVIALLRAEGYTLKPLK
ncbi:MAG TPA: TraB/GumN family protein [Saprospiraceae bacterium]|nr:TraB/GumN family protein [Saprospiraceae bacterium]HMP22598.1 TraB/GumN family protein [Saprospiraceae bacterium]